MEFRVTTLGTFLALGPSSLCGFSPLSFLAFIKNLNHWAKSQYDTNKAWLANLTLWNYIQTAALSSAEMLYSKIKVDLLFYPKC